MPTETAMLSWSLPELIAGLVLGLVIGLIAGRLLFRDNSRLGALQTDHEALAAKLAGANAEVEQLERELAMARDQVKPLADEVDRLRREKAARKAPPAATTPAGEGAAAGTAAQATGTAAPGAATSVGWQPGRKLPTFLDAPIGPTDDLSMLKGVGARLAARLREIGIFYFAQIADWSPEEVKLVDAKLDNFRGRIEKDKLIEQAKLLASGRITEYEARFGKLGGE